MEKFKNNIISVLLACVLFPVYVYAENTDTDVTKRKEREHIRSGNKLYNDKRFADAEVEYKKALGENTNSHLGNYNLALSLIQQSGGSNVEGENNPLKDATELLHSVAQYSKDAKLCSKAYYNLGNLAYNQQDYGTSVEMYKNALRQNPDDEQARENLRLAQLKKQEQEQNKENQDKKDNSKDKDKEQDKQDKKEEKQQQQQQQQQQPKPQEMSKENMEQILQTMQNQEKATQEKVNAQKPQNVRKTGNQW